MFKRLKESQITKYVLNKLFDICIRSDLVSMRFFVSMANFVFGLMFFLQEMQTYISPTHYFILHIIPGELWGGLFILAASMNMFSLIMAIRNYWTLVFDCILSSVVWTSYTTATMLAYKQLYVPNIIPIDILSSVLITLLVWWCMIRCLADRKNNNGGQ